MKKVLLTAGIVIASLVVIVIAALFFLLSRIEKEPEIVNLEDPVLFAGLSTKTDVKSIYRDASRLGNEFTGLKEAYGIANAKEPWAFVAYSRDFDEAAKSWEYIMGDVVTSLDSIPEGLAGFEIPAGTYAVFPIRAKVGFLWGIEIARMKRYVFGEWLPKSGYRSTGCDFEYHDERSKGSHASIRLYVAVEKQ